MSDILFQNYIDGNNSSNTASFSGLLNGGLSNTITFVGNVDGNASSPRIKERISDLVAKQFPEFIQSDYTTLVAFLQAYYKFLELDFSAQEVIQNARSYNDIDQTAPAFVYYFLQNYASLIPATVLTDKKLLIKKINDLYQAKGSSLSFKLLFRLLFDEIVDVKYPFENVLRASDGIFRQKTTIIVETVSGDRDDIANRFLTYTYGGATYQTPILSVKFLTTTLAEVSLDNNKLAPVYTVGDSVYVYGARNTLVFKGTISATTTGYGIQRGGLGFRVGQVFNINSGDGVGTLVKVSKVSSIGEIQSLKFINFGYGYTETFVINLRPDSSSAQTADLITDSTRNELDSGSIFYSTQTDAQNYFANDTGMYISNTQMYSYTSVATFSDGQLLDPLTGGDVPADTATITFTLGGLARYPGAYTKNRGFISDLEIRLEDSLLYQPFAYQLSTQIDISKFYNVVTQLLHPAGQRLFNNRTLENSIDISANVATSSISFGNINFEAYDQFDVGDQISVQQYLTRGDLDSVELLSLANITINKSIENNVSTVEFTETGSAYAYDYTDGFGTYFEEEYIERLYTFTF